MLNLCLQIYWAWGLLYYQLLLRPLSCTDLENLISVLRGRGFCDLYFIDEAAEILIVNDLWAMVIPVLSGLLAGRIGTLFLEPKVLLTGYVFS